MYYRWIINVNTRFVVDSGLSVLFITRYNVFVSIK
jgi:hypothetical protein